MRKTTGAAVVVLAAASAFAEIDLVAPKRGEVVPVLTASQRAFLDLPPAEKRARFADEKYRRKEMGLPVEEVDGMPRKSWWPKTTRLEWKAKDGAKVYAVRVVGRNGDLAFDQCVTGTTVAIDNLMVATDYDWSVTAKGESGKSSFRTEDVPLRLCRFPSVGNARDLGGVRGLDGRRVKQGMVYRSMRFNEKTRMEGRKPIAVGEPRGTPVSRAYIVRRFGLKTDLDLRIGTELYGLDASPLGNGVKLEKLPFGAYKGAVGDHGKKRFKRIFKLLLDENSYPLVFHCAAGQDRTGSLAFLLEALLGVDDACLSDDWAYTGFYNRSSRFRYEKFYDALPRELRNRYPAATTRASVEAFALAAGITDAEIARFREIMLEKK